MLKTFSNSTYAQKFFQNRVQIKNVLGNPKSSPSVEDNTGSYQIHLQIVGTYCMFGK